MNLSSRWRLLILISAMACLTALIVGAAITSWLEVRDVRRHFGRIQSEGFQNDVGHLRGLILDANSALITFEVTDRAEDRQRFEQKDKELSTWIKSAKTVLITDQERTLFDQIETTYAKYAVDAKLIANTNPLDEPKNVLITRFGQIERASDHLLSLATTLAEVRRQSFAQFVRESEKEVVILQQVIFGSLIVLIILVGWSARVIYRDTIAPLRRKLIETREVAERREKLASLGVLAAGVAHEIRNPLTAIKARLFTQKKALTAGTPAYNDGEFIAKEITRLERIVREFLSFARPAEPQQEAVSPRHLLSEVHELLAPQLQENAIDLALETGPDLPVAADAQQLKQVLINLVQNAADSIGQKGQITLRGRVDKIALSGQVRQVVILEVEDNGRGIPVEVQERLFDPFFSTKSTGTGLGLSIAARIVEQHGGALQYQTQVNRGTTFGIILPAKNGQ